MALGFGAKYFLEWYAAYRRERATETAAAEAARLKSQRRSKPDGGGADWQEMVGKPSREMLEYVTERLREEREIGRAQREELKEEVGKLRERLDRSDKDVAQMTKDFWEQRDKLNDANLKHAECERELLDLQGRVELLEKGVKP